MCSMRHRQRYALLDVGSAARNRQQQTCFKHHVLSFTVHSVEQTGENVAALTAPKACSIDTHLNAVPSA